MALFTLDHWPLLFISAAMIVAAVIDGWKLKVPNWLTYPLVLGRQTRDLDAPAAIWEFFSKLPRRP